MTDRNHRLAVPMIVLIPLSLAAGCTPGAPADAAPASMTQEQKVKRGEYLVTVGACNDCHTPFKMGANGPEPDMSRRLSGHPADLEMPPPPLAEGPWVVTIGATNTAWSGPWGISYTANITPDGDTGIGTWTEQIFIDTIRNGRHMGRGRPLLPPMPFPFYSRMTDQDLASVFAYLKSLPAIANRVPPPVPPASR